MSNWYCSGRWQKVLRMDKVGARWRRWPGATILFEIKLAIIILSMQCTQSYSADSIQCSTMQCQYLLSLQPGCEHSSRMYRTIWQVPLTRSQPSLHFLASSRARREMLGISVMSSPTRQASTTWWKSMRYANTATPTYGIGTRTATECAHLLVLSQ